MKKRKSLKELSPHAGRPSSRALRWLRRWVRPWTRIAFRPTLLGQENLPKDRPFLLVANHSGGVGLAELMSFAALFPEQVGTERPLAGFALAIGFDFWPMSSIHRELGSVPSTYEHAYEALEQDVSLLVFPGGDFETLRPIWHVHKVDFNQRKGFLRIARKANVAIVPMGIRNGHWTAPVLFRSTWLTRLAIIPMTMGLKRWGVTLLGVLGAIALAFLPINVWLRAFLVWLWLSTPLMMLPFIPATLRFRIGSPLETDELFDKNLPEDQSLQQGYDKVVETIQALVNQGKKDL